MFTHFAIRRKRAWTPPPTIAPQPAPRYLGLQHLLLGLLQTDPDLLTGLYPAPEGEAPAPAPDAVRTALTTAVGAGSAAEGAA